MECATMFCPECRAEHPEACGTKVFVAAECPVCLVVERPSVLLPCFHGLCPACFEDVGGALRPPYAPPPAAWPADSSAEDYKDESVFIPPPTHVV